jgi:hypothetical protein
VNALVSIDDTARLLAKLAKVLKGLGEGHGAHESDFWWLVSPQTWKWIKRLIESATLPEVLFAFGIAVGASLAVVGLVMGADVLATAIRRGRARVFISYEHGHDHIVADIVRRMTNARLRVERLPYVDAPDHDDLLEDITLRIQRCDVFLCLPGPNPSFVESEVFMARGAQKPLLFVAADPNSPTIPNTAKKGYPVFDLMRLNAAGIQVLAAFCSYVAGDWRAKLRMYGTLRRYYGKCAGILLGLYASAIITMAVLPRQAHPHPSSVWGWLSWFFSGRDTLIFFGISLAFVAIPYSIFCFIRFAFQRRLRAALSHQTFENGLLRDVLDTSLEGQDIVSILCPAKPVAHHELPEAVDRVPT